MVQGNDVITEKVPVGGSAVVVGANYLGMELAADLAAKGKKVILLEARDEIGPEVAPALRSALLKELGALGVEMRANAPVTGIKPDGVQINSGKDAELYSVENVVLAVGAKPVNNLMDEVKGLAPEFYAVGDCIKPRRAVYAVHEGANLGLKI